MSKTEHKIDRAGWGHGPWDSEPDRLQFKTANGMAALVVRNSMGALCGYVGVPVEHAMYEVNYNQGYNLIVHGGLTFSGKCHGAICHVPEDGEPDDVWWLGFDCNHSGDYAPTMAKYRDYLTSLSEQHEHYKDIEYVKDQCEKLSQQL